MRRAKAGDEHAFREPTALIDRFAIAFESGDVRAMAALLTDDAMLTMPPEPLQFEGRHAIGGFLVERSWWGADHVRLVPIRANGQPHSATTCWIRTRASAARAACSC